MVYLIDFFLKVSSIFSIFLVLMLPYIICYSIFLKYSILGAYLYYLKPSYLFQPLDGIAKSGEFFINCANFLLSNTILIDIEDFFVDSILRSIFIYHISDFYFQTMRTGLIFLIIGILIPTNKFTNLNKKQKELIIFIKFTFILTFLFYLLNQIISFYHLTPSLSRLDSFLNYYLIRLFELFSGYWVILFVIPFVYFIIFFRRSIFEYNFIKKILNKRKVKKKVENKSIKRKKNFSKLNYLILGIFI